MAITTIAHGEKVYTGNDLKALRLAKRIGESHYNRAFASSGGNPAFALAAGSYAQSAAMRQWNSFQQMKSAAIKSDLHSFAGFNDHISSREKYKPGSGPLWGKAAMRSRVLGNIEETKAALLTSRFGTGPSISARLPDDIQERAAEERISARERIRAAVEKSRAARESSKANLSRQELEIARTLSQREGERIATEREEAVEAGKLRSAIRIAKMRRESANRFGPRSYDAQDQKQVKTIERGVQKAFGGKSLGLLRDVFGYGFGYGHIARAAIGAAVSSSHGAQASHLAGIGAGVDMKTMRGLENAAEMLGGSKGDAAQFAKNITHFLHSSQMGLGWGPFESFYKYGIKLHSGMSRKEIMWNIAEGYSNLDQGRKGSFAGEGVVPAAFLSAMGEGGDKFLEALAKGAEYVPENLSELRENSLALRELGVSWNRFVDTSIPLFTDAVNAATGALNAITRGSEFLNDVRKLLTDENNGEYNVVQDYLNNLRSAQNTASSYGAGNVLAGALVPSGVGMMTPNPNFGSTTNIVVNAPGLTQAEAQEIADAVGRISRKSSVENINYVIYASENF